MCKIREFNLKSNMLLEGEAHDQFLESYPTIYWKLHGAMSNPLVFFSQHNISDQLIDKLLADAEIVLMKFYESAYCDRIFKDLKDNRERKSTTSTKAPQPFERVKTFKSGYWTLCEEDTYKYYEAIFKVTDGQDWFPLWVCGLLIVAQDKLIFDINECGDPMAPFVHDCIEIVLDPLLDILAYEQKVLADSALHKQKSVTSIVRGVRAKELYNAFRSEFYKRKKIKQSTTFKEILRCLEQDGVVERLDSGKYVFSDCSIESNSGSQDVEVSEQTMRSWLTECKKLQK